MNNGLFFILGALLFLRPLFFERWLTWRWWQTACAIVLVAAVVPLAMGGEHYRLALIAGPCAAMGATWLILASMKHWGDMPNASIKLFVDASLTIYLLHHPIILALGIITTQTSLPAEIEWLCVSVSALALSLAAYLVIKHLPVLYYGFNGQSPRNRPIAAN